MPAKVRAAGEKTRKVAVRTGAAVVEATPESIKELGIKAADAALASGVVETVEHPSHEAEHEAVRVVGIGPEPHRPVQRVEPDIREPRGC
jgi:hypothetical protein